MLKEGLEELRRSTDEARLNMRCFTSLKEALLLNQDSHEYLKLNSLLTRCPEVRRFYAPNEIRVANISSYNNKTLEYFLNAHLFLELHGLALYTPLFNQLRQEFIAADSGLYAFEPDIVYVDVQLEDIFPDAMANYACLDEAEKQNLLNEAKQLFEGLFAAFLDNRPSGRARIIVRELLPTSYASSPLILEPSGPDLTDELNRFLAATLAGKGIGYVLGVKDHLLRSARSPVFDHKMKYFARSPFSQHAYFLIASQLAYLIKMMTQGAKKCVIVDLDNTLWGGVLGEDGLNGIAVSEDYPGNIHREFQSYLLELYSRGILLAIVSKNNLDDVLEALVKNEKLLVKEHHFAAIRCNWEEKASNIADISREINITTDHMLFIDDNDLELEKVRMSLPEVTCVRFPSPGIEFRRQLENSKSLGTLTLNDTDRSRGKLYYSERIRRSEKSSYSNIEDFIVDLQQVITAEVDCREKIPRIAQLTQRTNQFNMTTVRLDEVQTQQLMEDPGHSVFSISVKDRHGDSGLVGLAIVRREADYWEIENFLMSCRVLGRMIETDFVRYLTNTAIESGAKYMLAPYLRTRKNQPFEDFYEKHHFARNRVDADGITYRRDLGDIAVENKFLSKLEVSVG